MNIEKFFLATGLIKLAFLPRRLIRVIAVLVAGTLLGMMLASLLSSSQPTTSSLAITSCLVYIGLVLLAFYWIAQQVITRMTAELCSTSEEFATQAQKASQDAPYEVKLGFLIVQLGPLLVAMLSGARSQYDPIAWFAKIKTPTDEQIRRIEIACELFVYIANTEGPDLTRAWFIGMNVGDDETSPVEALRDDRILDVRVSAGRYLAEDYS